MINVYKNSEKHNTSKRLSSSRFLQRNGTLFDYIIVFTANINCTVKQTFTSQIVIYAYSSINYPNEK